MKSDVSDRYSYRLEAGEVVAVFGLSRELRGLVRAGLAAVIERAEVPVGVGEVRPVGLPSSPAAASKRFYEDLGRAAQDVRMLLGFGDARPLLEADVRLLARRLHVAEEVLRCDPEPVELYEVSRRLDEVRRVRLGWGRRQLVRGTADPRRCLNVVGMASVGRKKEASLLLVLHCAWSADPAGEVRGLVERWPLAVAPDARRRGR